MNQTNPSDRLAALRTQLGGIHPGAKTKVKDVLEPLVQSFIEHAPFAVLSTSNADGDCDASPKGGLPGFIRILDNRTLLLPDIGGNRLFQSYDNLATNPKAGLLFMIPGMEVTARVNGTTRLLAPEEVAQFDLAPQLHWQDDNSTLIQAIAVSVDEAYLHCPRAFKFSQLWDVDTIGANAARSLKSLMP